jgi:hypothetical protein
MLATWNTEMRRVVSDEDKNFTRSHLNQYVVWWLMPVIPSNTSQDPITNITREKWSGGVTQTVECLLCKNSLLSFQAEREREKKERRMRRRKRS